MVRVALLGVAQPIATTGTSTRTNAFISNLPDLSPYSGYGKGYPVTCRFISRTRRIVGAYEVRIDLLSDFGKRNRACRLYDSLRPVICSGRRHWGISTASITDHWFRANVTDVVSLIVPNGRPSFCAEPQTIFYVFSTDSGTACAAAWNPIFE